MRKQVVPITFYKLFFIVTQILFSIFVNFNTMKFEKVVIFNVERDT